MNLRSMVPALALFTVLLWLAGCAGAGPAGTGGSTQTRCGASTRDEQRPLFFVLCAESP